ncbi:hypothetical protein ACQJBY_007595 [Aegilops geniculata]
MLRASPSAPRRRASAPAGLRAPQVLPVQPRPQPQGLPPQQVRPDVNALRAHPGPLPPPFVLLAYGGEGFYYFIGQFVWLAKAGLLPAQLLPGLQRLSAWAELLGYVGSITIKLEVVMKMESSIKMRLAEGCGEENEAARTMRGKLLLKRLSIVQDVADAFMVLGDVTNGKGLLGSSTLTASIGLLLALISTHKNWNSC